MADDWRKQFTPEQLALIAANTRGAMGSLPVEKRLNDVGLASAVRIGQLTDALKKASVVIKEKSEMIENLMGKADEFQAKAQELEVYFESSNEHIQRLEAKLERKDDAIKTLEELRRGGVASINRLTKENWKLGEEKKQLEAQLQEKEKKQRELEADRNAGPTVPTSRRKLKNMSLSLSLNKAQAHQLEVIYEEATQPAAEKAEQPAVEKAAVAEKGEQLAVEKPVIHYDRLMTASSI